MLYLYSFYTFTKLKIENNQHYIFIPESTYKTSVRYINVNSKDAELFTKQGILYIIFQLACIRTKHIKAKTRDIRKLTTKNGSKNSLKINTCKSPNCLILLFILVNGSTFSTKNSTRNQVLHHEHN